MSSIWPTGAMKRAYLLERIPNKDGSNMLPMRFLMSSIIVGLVDSGCQVFTEPDTAG